ncbi:MAG TPA: hypothetical protein PKL63_14895, partial [Dermatophilaceae bacterium]|nr:hypothetical protein [Dermatophilaceae bacterium]
ASTSPRIPAATAWRRHTSAWWSEPGVAAAYPLVLERAGREAVDEAAVGVVITRPTAASCAAPSPAGAPAERA